jgi:hypothetical protein
MPHGKVVNPFALIYTCDIGSFPFPTARRRPHADGFMGCSGDCYVFGFLLLDYNHGEHHVRPGARAAEILTLSGFEGFRPGNYSPSGETIPAVAQKQLT